MVSLHFPKAFMEAVGLGLIASRCEGVNVMPCRILTGVNSPTLCSNVTRVCARGLTALIRIKQLLELNEGFMASKFHMTSESNGTTLMGCR